MGILKNQMFICSRSSKPDFVPARFQWSGTPATPDGQWYQDHWHRQCVTCRQGAKFPNPTALEDAGVNGEISFHGKGKVKRRHLWNWMTFLVELKCYTMEIHGFLAKKQILLTVDWRHPTFCILLWHTHTSLMSSEPELVVLESGFFIVGYLGTKTFRHIYKRNPSYSMIVSKSSVNISSNSLQQKKLISIDSSTSSSDIILKYILQNITSYN